MHITPDCVDPLYRNPIYTHQSEEPSPIHHRRVSGYFNGIEIDFNVYLPHPRLGWPVLPTRFSHAEFHGHNRGNWLRSREWWVYRACCWHWRLSIGCCICQNLQGCQSDVGDLFRDSLIDFTTTVRKVNRGGRECPSEYLTRYVALEIRLQNWYNLPSSRNAVEQRNEVHSSAVWTPSRHQSCSTQITTARSWIV